MGKQDGDHADPNVMSNGNQSEDMSESVAKAFDTLAKAIQPIKADSHDQVLSYIDILKLYLMLFEPGPRHTKVVKNGTSCSSLGTQTYRVELGLIDPVSGYCDWVWYHAKCVGHDTSVRQHYNSEH